MYNNNISKEGLIAGFRKGAKELIHVHGKDLESKTAQEQHRVFFSIELQHLYEETLKKANHFSEGLKRTLEQELSSTFGKYKEFYYSRY